MPPKKAPSAGGGNKKKPAAEKKKAEETKEAEVAEPSPTGAAALSESLAADEEEQSNGASTSAASLPTLLRPKPIYNSFTFMADEADAFFEAEGQNGGAANGASGPPTLTEEERAAATAELKKTEDEINTLRQVLQARMKHAGELKRKLGLTPWTEVVHDMAAGLKTVRESGAYQKTAGAVSTGAEVVSTKLAGIRNSSAFKSFGDSVGSAYNNVKAKIAASASMQGFTGAQSPTEEDEKPPAPLS